MAGKKESHWTFEDFADVVSPDPAERDPWSPAPPIPDYDAEPPRRHRVQPDAGDYPQSDGADWDFADDELLDAEPPDQWTDAAAEPGALVEPDPTADASSQLRESLYPPDYSITDLSRELKIGELLMRLDPVTPEQHATCHELLRTCGIGRLRRWLPWLEAHAWSGATLQFFLEFHHHWESPINLKWWETFWWEANEQQWTPRYQSGTLTLDHCRELLERRAHCPVDRVIHPSWFAEWEECAAWELGVRSFASFAVFRARVRDGEHWLGHLVRQDRRTATEVLQCADRSYAPFMLPSFAQQYGFATDSTQPSRDIDRICGRHP